MSTFQQGNTTNSGKNRPTTSSLNCMDNSYINQVNYNPSTGNLQLSCNNGNHTFGYNSYDSGQKIKAANGLSGFGIGAAPSNSRKPFGSMYFYDTAGKLINSNLGTGQKTPPENMYHCANPGERIVGATVYYDHQTDYDRGVYKGMQLQCQAPVNCQLSPEMDKVGGCVGGKQKYVQHIAQKPEYGGLACKPETVYRPDTCGPVDCALGPLTKQGCQLGKRVYSEDILKPAANGGKCRPLMRTVSDPECAPQIDLARFTQRVEKFGLCDVPEMMPEQLQQSNTYQFLFLCCCLIFIMCCCYCCGKMTASCDNC